MGHIKITDLCVGDWVMYEGNHRKVALIDGVNGLIKFALSPNFVGVGAIEPIPLTQEMLEKNGFTLPWRKGKEWVLQSHTWRVGVTLRKNGYWHINSDEGKFCLKNARYIHQLQHALRLAGIDKEIEL